MEKIWNSLYQVMHEKSKIVPITKATYLNDEELVDNTILSCIETIMKDTIKEVDVRYAMALGCLTKRQKKKLGKWLRKAMRKNNYETKVD